MVAPLDAFKGFGKPAFTSDDKTWVALTLNKTGRNDGQYDFKGEDFVLPATVFTGVIKGDDHWLIASLSPGAINKGGCFEFKVWKNGETGAKGSFDKAAGEELGKQWQTDGSLAAVHVNNIPVLKTAVKILHELKIIVRPGNGEIIVRLNITEEQCPAVETALNGFWSYVAANGDVPSDKDPAYAHAVEVNKIGLMSLPVVSEEQLPQVVLYDLFGKPTGRKIDCFPFSGQLPMYDAVTVDLPGKEAPKGKGGGYGGGGSVDPVAVLNARRDFIIKEASALDESVKTLKDVYAQTLKSGSCKDFVEFLIRVMGS